MKIKIADRLAKIGVKNTETHLIAPVLPVTKKYYKTQIKKLVRENQNKE